MSANRFPTRRQDFARAWRAYRRERVPFAALNALVYAIRGSR